MRFKPFQKYVSNFENEQRLHLINNNQDVASSILDGFVNAIRASNPSRNFIRCHETRKPIRVKFYCTIHGANMFICVDLIHVELAGGVFKKGFVLLGRGYDSKGWSGTTSVRIEQFGRNSSLYERAYAAYLEYKLLK